MFPNLVLLGQAELITWERCRADPYLRLVVKFYFFLRKNSPDIAKNLEKNLTHEFFPEGEGTSRGKCVSTRLVVTVLVSQTNDAAASGHDWDLAHLPEEPHTGQIAFNSGSEVRALEKFGETCVGAQVLEIGADFEKERRACSVLRQRFIEPDEGFVVYVNTQCRPTEATNRGLAITP